MVRETMVFAKHGSPNHCESSSMKTGACTKQGTWRILPGTKVLARVALAWNQWPGEDGFGTIAEVPTRKQVRIVCGNHGTGKPSFNHWGGSGKGAWFVDPLRRLRET